MKFSSTKVSMAALTLSSLVVSFIDWARFGFSGTATTGAGAVAIGAFSYGFSGAVVGGGFSLVWLLVLKLTKQPARFPYALFIVVWLFFQLSAYFALSQR